LIVWYMTIRTVWSCDSHPIIARTSVPTEPGSSLDDSVAPAPEWVETTAPLYARCRFFSVYEARLNAIEPMRSVADHRMGSTNSATLTGSTLDS